MRARQSDIDKVRNSGPIKMSSSVIDQSQSKPLASKRDARESMALPRVEEFDPTADDDDGDDRFGQLLADRDASIASRSTRVEESKTSKAEARK